MKVTPKPKARHSMIERTAKNGSNVDGGCRAPGGFGQMAKVVKKATADTASVTAAAEYLLAISIASLQRRLAGAAVRSRLGQVRFRRDLVHRQTGSCLQAAAEVEEANQRGGLVDAAIVPAGLAERFHVGVCRRVGGLR